MFDALFDDLAPSGFSRCPYKSLWLVRKRTPPSDHEGIRGQSDAATLITG